MGHPLRSNERPASRDAYLPCDVDAYALKAKLLELFRRPNYQPPLLPAVALDLLALTRKSNVDVREATTLLKRDPLLAAQLLRVAQSPLYSRGLPMHSLEDAIVRLGLRRVSDLFFRASLEMRVLRVPGYAEVVDRLLLHSTFVAEVAYRVSKRVPGTGRDAFLAGLLHDVGILATLLALLELPDRPARFADAWPCVTSIHEECSGVVGRLWRLPAELTTVLGSHHTLVRNGEMKPLTGVVAIADALASEVGYGFDDETTGTDPEEVGQVLALGAADLRAIRAEVLALAARAGQSHAARR